MWPKNKILSQVTPDVCAILWLKNKPSHTNEQLFNYLSDGVYSSSQDKDQLICTQQFSQDLLLAQFTIQNDLERKLSHFEQLASLKKSKKKRTILLIDDSPENNEKRLIKKFKNQKVISLVF